MTMKRLLLNVLAATALCISTTANGMPPQLFQYTEPRSPSTTNGVALPQASKPKMQSQGEVFRVQVGQTLLLPCQVSNLGPMILIWKKGTRVLTAGKMMVRRDDRLDLQGTDLQIKGIKDEDSGEYICEVETDADEPIAIVHHVEILVPPSIEIQPSNGQVVVKKGTTVSLACQARGNPEPIISWGKAHDRMPRSDITNGGSTLTLSEVSRHNTGTYQCTASNGVGKDVTGNIHLQVLYEPEVKAENSNVHGGVGHQVELVCVVYSEPQADVLWYKDTMLLDSNGRRYMQKKGNRHTLLIRDVLLEDFGNYSCSASNMLGKSRAYFHIQGNPNTPIFNSRVDSRSRTSYKLSWITESYAPIEEYRLLYRKLPDDPSQEIFYAYNNIIINGVGTTGFEHHQSYILENLMPNSMYEAQIQAKNQFGWSGVSDKFQFYTREHDESIPIESSVRNPAPYGINSSSSSESQSRFWRLFYIFIAVLTMFLSHLFESVWSGSS